MDFRWKVSESVKDGVEEDLAKYDGQWVVDEAQDNPIVNDNYLVMKVRCSYDSSASVFTVENHEIFSFVFVVQSQTSRYFYET